MFKRLSEKLSILLVILITTTSLLGFLTPYNVIADAVYAADLFISEYIEGSSNNKAIEIYNGTAETVNLAEYSVELYANGTATATNTLNLTGTLASGAVYVIANGSAETGIKDLADIISAVTYFNGDDALVLKHSGVIIDSIGQVGFDPGTVWGTGDNTTAEHTLVRRSSITIGDPISDDTFDPVSEWDSYAQNTFSYLGSHTMDGYGGGIPVEQKVAAVTANPPSGAVDAGTLITLSTATEGASIFYGLGEAAADTLYTEPIAVNEDVTMKAIAKKEGYTDSEPAIFSYTIKAPAEELTIADARALAEGNNVTVSGVVTWMDGTTKVYIQDETAAIVVDLYYISGTKPAFAVGDEVTANGVLIKYNELLTIKLALAADIVKNSGNNLLPEPKLITIPDAKSETYEAQLVKLEGLTLGTIAASGNTSVTDASGNTINIYRILLPAGVAAGDTINVIAIVSQYRADYQLRIRSAQDVTEVELPDTLPPTIIHNAATSGNLGLDLEIKAEVTDDRQVSSVKLYYRVKGTAEYTMLQMSLMNGQYAAVIPRAEVTAAGIEYYIEAADGTNTATLPADISKPYEIVISCADILGPEITAAIPADKSVLPAAETKPLIKAAYSDISGVAAGSVKLILDEMDVTDQAVVTEDYVTYNPMQDLNIGRHTAAVELCDKLGNKTIFTWIFYIGEEQYNLYFGQLHSHSNYSDGLGSVEDAFSYAKNNAGVDFLAVTDHSNSFDNASISTLADGSNSSEWVNGHISADKYTDSAFVGIYAYEMTWSNGTGHINTFNTPGFENRETAKYKNADGLKLYYDMLKLFPDSISQLNHPGPTFGDFNDFAYYDPQIDQLITLIEVGNGEGATNSSNYFPSYSFYTRALDKGWHVSPTNNQDNHFGKWGDANTARTVILADGLTKENVYDAMRNMRTYATEDNNLRINYTLNGEAMGTIFAHKPSAVKIKVDLEDPDNEALGNISVITNGGKVAASKVLGTSKDTVEFNLAPDYSYYYIRVDQADKDIAVTAPVWISEVDKAGISRTTADTTLPIKGKNLKITTDYFNNENAPMVINSLVYSINGAIINAAPALESVNSLSTGSYTFDYAPLNAGKYNVDVKLIATINGVEKNYTDVLKLDVNEPALITKTVVDGSHFNDYVNGYYANNLGNFTTIANAEKITVNIEKTKLTDDLLKDARLLIISAPAKKADTSNGVSYTPQAFSDEDIAVVKRYADNGGNLLVCGIADYQDGTGVYQTSTQMNKLLEGIGATSRFNNDEVIDNTQKVGSQNFRLAFDDYNMNSPYLEGVVPGQTYSFYSGCSISLDSEALASGKTTWLVKGHDTTESVDSNRNLPGIALPKGSVYALAVEQLAGGGRMFIGGTVYISDFEVKAQLDNAAQLQNSNYNIAVNILNSIKNELPVSTISEVRSAQKGEVYCVEGTVTAGTIKDNAFFDTVYIQDQTGGINLYPVSGMDLYVGQKVRAIGIVDEFLGDLELRIIEFSIIDTSINPIAPTILTAEDAMSPAYGGILAIIKGNVINMDSQNLYINDRSGTARVFVDGYIGDGSNDASKEGKWDPMIMVGDQVSAIGLASVDTAGPRLRVRNTAEIVRIKDTVPPTIEITGVIDGGIYNTDVAPIISVNEGTISMTLDGNLYQGEAVIQEGTHILKVTATDRDSNAAQKEITFIIDKTAPVIFSNINDMDVIEKIHSLAITNTAEDTISGMAALETLLDGNIIQNSCLIDLQSLSFGTHHMIITATDKAGNSSIQEIDFALAATVKTVENLLLEFYKQEIFKNEGIYQSFIAKLDANNLKAFKNHIEAQKGKDISVETAELLLQYVDYIISK